MIDQTVQTVHLPDGMILKGPQSRLRFYTTVGLMSAAGIPIHKAVEFVAATCEEPTLAEFCDKAVRRMDAGSTLSFVVKQFPGCFPLSTYRAMRAGEMSGTLPEALLALSRMEERRLVAQGRLRGALIYPAAILLVALVLIVAPALIFGDMVKVLAELGVQLPVYTRAVLRVSELAGSPWVWVVCLLMGALFYQELTEERANARFHRWLRLAWSKMPGFSHLVTIWSNIHFCQSLALLMEVGIPITEALPVSLTAADDPVMEKARDAVLADVRNGATLAEALQGSGLILPFVAAFIQSGEEAGTLPENLRKAGAYLDTQLQTETQTILDLLQPILLLVTGLIVGAVAIGTLKPLSELLVI